MRQKIWESCSSMGPGSGSLQWDLRACISNTLLVMSQGQDHTLQSKDLGYMVLKLSIWRGKQIP